MFIKTWPIKEAGVQIKKNKIKILFQSYKIWERNEFTIEEHTNTVGKRKKI